MAVQPVPDAPASLPFPGLNEKAAGTYNAAAYAWGNQMPAYAAGIKALGDNVLANANDVKANADQVTTLAAETDAARDEAVASALTAINAPGTSATSSTTLAIEGEGGEPAFFIQPDKDFKAGMYVTMAHADNVMHGLLLAYDKVTGEAEMHVLSARGSGTYSSWTLALSGPPNPIPRKRLFYFAGA